MTKSDTSQVFKDVSYWKTHGQISYIISVDREHTFFKLKKNPFMLKAQRKLTEETYMNIIQTAVISQVLSHQYRK